MKASLNWLNSYLDRPLTLEEAAKLFTELGFPTESWEPVGGDWTMEVEVTSNRPDLLSHVGLAREAAAASGRELRGPVVGLEGVRVAGKAEQFASVKCEPPEVAAMCPLYTARVIRGVKIGPSPKWLVERLESVGLRSVNNVVDVTNFVMLELGQPLHAFDLAKLSGHAIVVRRAKKDEPFTAIDQSKHKLSASMLVIADADKPVALAGVMGGLDSEVSSSTKDVLLESAVFDPLSVRKASRALRLMSDSSYRFERGVDVAGVERASRRAAWLIAELAGGELAEGVIRVGVDDPAPRRVTMRVARCQALTGVEIPATRMVELLGKIGVCPVLEDGGKVVACSAPSHRMDLEREVDLIEEVIRLHGLEHVPMRERIEIAARPAPVSLAARGQLRHVLTAHGYYETVTFSFVAPKQGKAFLPAGTSGVMVDDDRRKAEPMLRPSLLPSLLTCRKANQDAGNRDVRLFETSATWVRRGEEKGAIVETARLAMLADAPAAGEAVRELRGVIDELQMSLAGTQALTYEPASRANLSAAAEIKRGGKVLGFLGVLDGATQGLFDLQTPVVVAELDLDALLEKYPPARKVAELPRFPAVERDLSVIVEETVTWQAIEGVVLGLGVTWLESVGFVGVYRGKPIESGRKSVTLRMVFRDPTGTLRHEQVDEQVRRVVEALGAKVGASLRA